jgi:hypothetical protein
METLNGISDYIFFSMGLSVTIFALYVNLKELKKKYTNRK